MSAHNTLLISRTSANAAADLSAMRKGVSSFAPEQILYAVEYSERPGANSNPERAGSVYAPSPRQTFKRVVIGPSVRLWRGQWSDSFLTNAFRWVAPAGYLVTLFPERAASGYTQRDVAELLGSNQKVERSWLFRAEKMKGFQRGANPLPKVTSILSWYFENADKVLDAHLAHAGDELARDSLRNVINGTASELPAAIASAISMQAYYVAGIGYKAPAVAHILRSLQGESVGGRLIDVGGGYGLLAAELLLDRALSLEEAITVDLSTSNEKLANLLSPYVHAVSEKKRFQFALSNAIDFAFPAGTSMISFVGSLLYVPKELRAQVISRAIDALRPGGVLLIHENIKAVSYVRDYELMFEPAEIDGLLEAYGQVRYFSSSEPKELPSSRVGRSTVFRAIVKAS